MEKQTANGVKRCPNCGGRKPGFYVRYSDVFGNGGEAGPFKTSEAAMRYGGKQLDPRAKAPSHAYLEVRNEHGELRVIT